AFQLPLGGLGTDTGRFGGALDEAIELPRSGQTLEVVGPGIFELQATAADELMGGGRYVDVTGSGGRHDPRREMDRESIEVTGDLFDLAGMDAGSDLDASGAGGVGDRGGGPDRPLGSVEEREKSVARRLHETAPIAV